MYSVYQYFSEENVHVKVARNDQVTCFWIEQLNLAAIVISPGPGTPEQAGKKIT